MEIGTPLFKNPEKKKRLLVYENEKKSFIIMLLLKERDAGHGWIIHVKRLSAGRTMDPGICEQAFEWISNFCAA